MGHNTRKSEPNKIVEGFIERIIMRLQFSQKSGKSKMLSPSVISHQEIKKSFVSDSDKWVDKDGVNIVPIGAHVLDTYYFEATHFARDFINAFQKEFNKSSMEMTFTKDTLTYTMKDEESNIMCVVDVITEGYDFRRTACMTLNILDNVVINKRQVHCSGEDLVKDIINLVKLSINDKDTFLANISILSL